MIGGALHALMVSLLLGGAALLVEPVARACRVPTRVLWGGAMAASVALAGWGIAGPLVDGWRSAPAPDELSQVASLPPGDATHAGASGETAFGGAWWAAPPALLGTTLDRAASILPEPSAATREWILAGWGAGTLALFALLAGGLARHARRRRGWPAVQVLGQVARLSPGDHPSDGPAVAGLRHPEIILPRWALELPRAELDLVLRHEAEHRAARDPWLLAGAAFLVALFPWNPVLWWQLRRLRDAVEVDCDTRVLAAAGRPRRRYAELLLKVGERAAIRAGSPSAATASPFAFPAIGGTPSQLERRIRAMRPSSVRPLPLAAATAAALVLAVSACVADRPSPAEPDADAPVLVEEVPVESQATLPEVIEVPAPPSEREEPLIGIYPPPGGDAPTAAEDDSDRFTVIEVPAPPAAQYEQVEILPRQGDRLAGERIDVQGELPRDARVVIRQNTNLSSDTAPLMVVDGVIHARGIDELPVSPEQIESIEVVKGYAAASLYGSRGANGVILIRTKGAIDRGTPPGGSPPPPGG
jgi:TonB-dependent SusC/RagA subfamily outer membrane receptor